MIPPNTKKAMEQSLKRNKLYELWYSTLKDKNRYQKTLQIIQFFQLIKKALHGFEI